MKRSPSLITALATCLTAGASHAYTFQIDTFAVWKNVDQSAIGNPIDLLTTPPVFYDNFADLAAPPSAPNYTPLGGGGAAMYGVFGSVGPETIIGGQGILTLDSSGTTPNDHGVLVQQATLLTNIDPASPVGLKQVSTNFAVGGVYNLINPGNNPGSYGVRLTDITVGTGNDTVSLSVHGTTAGGAVIQFSRFDNNTGMRSILDQQALETGHDQIGLGLTYADPDGPDPKAVYAGYFYLDNDAPSGFTGMNGYTQIFNGEVFTRPAFYAALTPPVPIPEPAEYALLLAGLGLIGWRVRRRV
ncbi:MAG: PEP-CTERM sorting domain-containing protein [Thiobacillaceae bacterium]|jgi:hypothetical protein|nr:PEP-CTERM sorting domain-containing protein [Thiobacillaceae bacterium]